MSGQVALALCSNVRGSRRKTSAQEQAEIDSYEQELGSKSTGPDQIQTGCAGTDPVWQARPLGRGSASCGSHKDSTDSRVLFTTSSQSPHNTTHHIIRSGTVKAFRAVVRWFPKVHSTQVVARLRIENLAKNPSPDPASFRRAGAADFPGCRGRGDSPFSARAGCRKMIHIMWLGLCCGVAFRPAEFFPPEHERADWSPVPAWRPPSMVVAVRETRHGQWELPFSSSARLG